MLGREADFTEAALSLCAKALRYAAADHPDDARLQEAARRARLITITFLQRNLLELRDPNQNIIRDRMNECAACEYHNPPKGCVRCEKYGSATAKVGYIKKHLGEEAYQLMCDYYEELEREFGKKE